jgi:lincosamide nucleotidyltransferase A/C/D/E
MNSLNMSAEDAVELLKLFEAHHITVWVDGGWGVDALLGEQTRLHNDLDLALAHQDVPTLRALIYRSSARRQLGMQLRPR